MSEGEQSRRMAPCCICGKDSPAEEWEEDVTLCMPCKRRQYELEERIKTQFFTTGPTTYMSFRGPLVYPRFVAKPPESVAEAQPAKKPLDISIGARCGCEYSVHDYPSGVRTVEITYCEDHISLYDQDAVNLEPIRSRIVADDPDYEQQEEGA